MYTKGRLLFSGITDTLNKLRSQFEGSNLNLRGPSKEFSDIEDMLKQEIYEFEVCSFSINVSFTLREISKLPFLCVDFVVDDYC